MKRPKGSDYAVGFGRPPTHTRFQKGQSGNPKGRPKGSRNAEALLASILKEKVKVIENGRQKTITKLEALMKGLVTRALKGDDKSFRQILAMLPEGEARAITIILDAADSMA